MNKLNIESIAQDRVKVDVQDKGAGMTLIFTGDIDMEDPSRILDPLFEKVHSGSINTGIKEIEVDFKGLNFLNSSGIKSIAKWIMKLATLPDDKKYAIKLLHNKSITWQVTSLPTLTYLVPGAVQVV